MESVYGKLPSIQAADTPPTPTPYPTSFKNLSASLSENVYILRPFFHILFGKSLLLPTCLSVVP